mmetsp:Transcript_75105/g.244171  ORF Transcript_75105/g.244171 Transcript_75105/m.244171 type:complete len:208 (-) Transcript_75105:588-1211(-)
MSDGIAQAIHNGPALPRDALALQLRGVRGALRGLHHSDLVRLGSHQCGLPQALLLVDLVHGLRHVVVRHEVDHQGLVNLEAVLGHLRRQLAVDAISHLIFFFERLVQSHGRNHFQTFRAHRLLVEARKVPECARCPGAAPAMLYLRGKGLLGLHLGPGGPLLELLVALAEPLPELAEQAPEVEKIKRILVALLLQLPPLRRELQCAG